MQKDHISEAEKPNPFVGSIKVTCHEAAILLNNDLVTRAWFRPDGYLDHHDSDVDVAFVWYKKDEMLQDNIS